MGRCQGWYISKVLHKSSAIVLGESSSGRNCASIWGYELKTMGAILSVFTLKQMGTDMPINNMPREGSASLSLSSLREWLVISSEITTKLIWQMGSII